MLFLNYFSNEANIVEYTQKTITQKILFYLKDQRCNPLFLYFNNMNIQYLYSINTNILYSYSSTF